MNTYLLKLIFPTLIGHVQFFSPRVNEHLLVEVDFSVLIGHVQDSLNSAHLHGSFDDDSQQSS